MPDDNKYTLSRRKALLGLGTIGVAGAGAGVGTSALFTDEEEFEDNSITAGTLDMSVTAEIVAANQYWEDEGIIGGMKTADGAPVTGLNAADVKPGDWAIICFTIDVLENPGCVTITTEELTNYENGRTEPEEDVDSTGGGSLGTPLNGEGQGELQNKLVAEVWENFDDTVDSESPRDYLTNQDPTTPDGTTLAGADDTYSTGVTVGGGTAFNSRQFYLLLELPSEVGNEVQSDAVEWDLKFDAVQARNNSECALPDEDDDDGSGGGGGSGNDEVTVQGFPSDNDRGATIEKVEVTFSNAFDSVAGTDWSAGPSGTENVIINGNTVRLEYPDNSIQYSSDTFLELTVDGINADGTQTAEFVFEPDDDSAVDDSDSY